MVRYSVPICTMNMADTVRASLESILKQIRSDYEVVVVDDGSDDGTLEVLETLSAEYDALRVVHGDNDNLAEARNQSFEVARGKYVFESLDADDRYEPVLADFAHLYHELESGIDEPFYLDGRSINMAPTELLREYGYRSMGYGEDKDFRRRLLADDRILFVDHAPVCEEIGYSRGTVARAKVAIEEAVAQFRSGVTFSSFVSYHTRRGDRLSAFKTVIAPYAFLRARREGVYDPVPGYRRTGRLPTESRRRREPIQTVARRNGVDLDLGPLSEAGRRIFLDDDSG